MTSSWSLPISVGVVFLVALSLHGANAFNNNQGPVKLTTLLMTIDHNKGDNKGSPGQDDRPDNLFKSLLNSAGDEKLDGTMTKRLKTQLPGEFLTKVIHKDFDAKNEVTMLNYLQAYSSKYIQSLYGQFVDSCITWNGAEPQTDKGACVYLLLSSEGPTLSAFVNDTKWKSDVRSLDGGVAKTLAAPLEPRMSGVGRMAMEIMWQLLEAVDFIGQHKITHRAISEKNIILNQKENRLKLSDFVIADYLGYYPEADQKETRREEMVRVTKLWIDVVVGIVIPTNEGEYKAKTAGSILDMEVNLYFHTFIKNILFGTITSTQEALVDLHAQFGV